MLLINNCINYTDHSLDTAPGLKLGVQVDAVAVPGGRRAGDVCGPWARKTVLHGLVVEVLGTGLNGSLKLNGTNVMMNRTFTAST